MCGTMCDLSHIVQLLLTTRLVSLCGFGLNSNGIAGNCSDETSVFAKQGKSQIIYVTVYSEGYF